MAVAKNSDVADVQEALVSEVVQRELAAASKLGGLFSDFSALAGKGTYSVKIPKASSFTVGNRDNATPTPASPMSMTFGFDEIILNKSRFVYYVIPGDIELDAKPSFELTSAERAASAHGRAMDIEKLTALWDGANGANDIDFVSGTSDIEDTLLSMIQKADEAEMLDDGNRFLLVRPQERKELLGVANFVQADRYGDRTPLISGELGSVYGVRVVVLNHSVATKFVDGNMILCHRDSLGYAFHRQPTHDMEKAISFGAGSMAHTWDVKWGLKALAGGNLIVRAYEASP